MTTRQSNKPEDRRVRRTKASLGEALMTLIVDKGYDKVTVQDIIERADVGRSTFYAHYETKDDLLLVALEHLAADIELHMTDEPSDDVILPAVGVFSHLAKGHDEFKALMGSKGIELVHNAAMRALSERARTVIQRRADNGEQHRVPTEVRVAFLAGSLQSLLMWWLDNDMPYPPEEMAAIFYDLTEGA